MTASKAVIGSQLARLAGACDIPYKPLAISIVTFDCSPRGDKEHGLTCVHWYR